MSNIQIPMIFDVSANGTVYGEDISGDEIVISHLNLVIASPGTTVKSDFIAAMKNILYSDAPETDVSGVLFYKVPAASSTGPLAAGSTVKAQIGTAIKNLLVGTASNKTKLIHSGSTAQTMFGAPLTAGNYATTGIPIGFKQTTEHAGADSALAATWYNQSFIDSDGAELHRILIRVAATHLMGHPFAQAFIQENTILNDLSNTDFTSQINSHLLTAGANTLAVAANGVGGQIVYTSGKHIPILQTIYEQLLRTNLAQNRVQDDNNDLSNNTDVSGIARPLTFIGGNTVTFFIRPKMFFALDLSGGIAEMTSAVGTTLGISGTEFGTSTGIGGTGSAGQSAVFNDIFKCTGAAAATGFKWLVGFNDGTSQHQGNLDNALNQYGTNLTWDSVVDQSGGAIAMLDAHVWKISVTL
jgi:hypothetical protein